MKEFDLEAAKAGKKVMTRDGRKARIVDYDYKGNAPLLVIVENKNSEPLSGHLRQSVQAQTAESVYEYNENGEVCAPHLNSNFASDLTLVMVTEKHEGYANVYKDPMGYYISGIYDKAIEAISSVPIGYIDTIKIEWEE